MKVILLGLEFFINNLGCEALSYSFVSELNRLAEKLGKKLEIKAIVFADKEVPTLPGTQLSISCIGIHYKSLSFWSTIKREFKTADIIFDFTMGDSFSDIYGIKRFVLDALIKTAAIQSKTPYILGPQTYGPFQNRIVKRWAKWILKKADKVYTRDEASKLAAEKLSAREIILTTDVAFALPFEKKELKSNGRVRVGFNPSGLLWKGGYTGNNQFGLSLDYQEYCWRICEELSREEGYEVYLIPHVGTSASREEGCENDGMICEQIRKKYPEMKLISDIRTPMEIKGYLAAMDVFVGARMHATIGAFSSGVATIPVSYSRKFEGLYDSLKYDYLIHAHTDSTEEAVEKTMTYIRQYQRLTEAVSHSLTLVRKKQDYFREQLLLDLQQASGREMR